MSWSVAKKMGTPAKVRAAAESDFDSAAKNYAGTAEADDILAAKASVLAWLDKVPPESGAIVEAGGSRGDNWLTIKVECTSIKLLV